MSPRTIFPPLIGMPPYALIVGSMMRSASCAAADVPRTRQETNAPISSFRIMTHPFRIRPFARPCRYRNITSFLVDMPPRDRTRANMTNSSIVDGLKGFGWFVISIFPAAQLRSRRPSPRSGRLTQCAPDIDP